MARWPGPLPRARVEPPAWFRCFVLEEWAEPGDDEVRHPGGALVGAEEVARRRWSEECRRWAAENGLSVADWLREARAARRAARGWGP